MQNTLYRAGMMIPSVPSEVRNCAVPPHNLRSEISFSCTLQQSKLYTIRIV